MKCTKCGMTYYGNYCPNCGTKADTNDSDYYPEFDSAPYNEQPKKRRGTDYAVIALILGIVAVLLSFTMSSLVYLIGIAAIVLGIIALKGREKKGKPIVAIALGSISLVLVILARIFAVSFIYHGLTGGEIGRGSQNEYGFYDILPDLFGGMGIPDIFDGEDTPDFFYNEEVPDFIIPN